MGTNTPKAARVAASHFANYISHLIGQSVRKYDISIEDQAILALVYAESTAPLRGDAYLAARFGHNERGLPNEYRRSVNLKFIHTSLGLSRETTRRKLERLVGRGFLMKVQGGYLFPNVAGDHAFARDFRVTLLDTLERIAQLASGVPESQR